MLTYPHIDPVAISLGPLSVRWYGLMYLAGFVAFVALGRWRISRRPDLKWTANPEPLTRPAHGSRPDDP